MHMSFVFDFQNFLMLNTHTHICFIKLSIIILERKKINLKFAKLLYNNAYMCDYVQCIAYNNKVWLRHEPTN